MCLCDQRRRRALGGVPEGGNFRTQKLNLRVQLIKLILESHPLGWGCDDGIERLTGKMTQQRPRGDGGRAGWMTRTYPARRVSRGSYDLLLAGYWGNSEL